MDVFKSLHEVTDNFGKTPISPFCKTSHATCEEFSIEPRAAKLDTSRSSRHNLLGVTFIFEAITKYLQSITPHLV